LSFKACLHEEHLVGQKNLETVQSAINAAHVWRAQARKTTGANTCDTSGDITASPKTVSERFPVMSLDIWTLVVFLAWARQTYTYVKRPYVSAIRNV
jgi:hypothetical protein